MLSWIYRPVKHVVCKLSDCVSIRLQVKVKVQDKNHYTEYLPLVVEIWQFNRSKLEYWKSQEIWPLTKFKMSSYQSFALWMCFSECCLVIFSVLWYVEERLQWWQFVSLYAHYTLATFHHWCWLAAKRVQYLKSCLTQVLCCICCCITTSIVARSIQDLYRSACCVGLCLAGLDPLW